MGEMRKFETGATRDTAEGKYEYDGFLSPIVLESFAAYMHKHRKQADGSMRGSGNWKKGIPKEVYQHSMFRHMFDLWKIFDGHPVKEPVEEVVNAVMFNLMGWLHEHLRKKQKPKRGRRRVES